MGMDTQITSFVKDSVELKYDHKKDRKKFSKAKTKCDISANGGLR